MYYAIWDKETKNYIQTRSVYGEQVYIKLHLVEESAESFMEENSLSKSRYEIREVELIDRSE